MQCLWSWSIWLSQVRNYIFVYLFIYLCIFFNSCQNCQCNSSGSLDSVCNVTNGECHCKSFVTGMNCDTCLSGYQLLQADNPFGCSKGIKINFDQITIIVLFMQLLKIKILLHSNRGHQSQ